MKLSDEQIAVIERVIRDSDVTTQSLKEDLLDHLCCVVEIKQGKDIPFDIALREAINELAPQGLDAIQAETLYLINPAKLIFMRKFIFSIGLVSAISLSIGWLFSVLRWPGGVELFNYGFLVFLLGFIPLLAIDRYKVHLRKALSEKLRLILGAMSAIIVGVSLVFKLLHLQWAEHILVVGVIIFTFGFLPFLFFSLYKKAVS